MINHKHNGFVVDGDSIDQLSYWISELLLKADLRKKLVAKPENMHYHNMMQR